MFDRLGSVRHLEAVSGDWIIVLAERSSLALPVDRIEQQWRQSAAEYLLDREFSDDAADNVVEQMNAAVGTCFSICEIELFVSGTSLEEVLWRRLSASGSIALPIENMAAWEVSGARLRRWQDNQRFFLRLLEARERSLKERDEKRQKHRPVSDLVLEAKPYTTGVRWGRALEDYLAPKRTQS